jgi:hypothetical protein
MSRPLPKAGAIRQGGFTFVEMLVAAGLTAVFLGAGALVFQCISVHSKRLTSMLTIDIGTSAAQNFYGQDTGEVRVYSAPNYGRLPLVKNLRDTFFDDLARSESVYCLPRSGLNTVRPATLTYPAPNPGDERPDLDTPEAFRQFLHTAEPTSVAIFDTAIRNVPPTSKPNASIFLLSPAANDDEMNVSAVYDIDFLTPTGRDGVYASVRRYKQGSLTHYYDVYYEDQGGDAFLPLFVAFERQALLNVVEGTDIDRFKVAPGSPFYLIWWPDPSINPLSKEPWIAAEDAASPRATYEQMAGKTGFLLTAPMFPSL